jgi:uncharacterized protein
MRPSVLLFLAPLVVSLAAFRASPGEQKPPGPEGIWSGTLKAGLIDLRLVVKLSKKDDGTWAGTMDSIDQGAKGLVIDVIEIKDGTVRLELKKLKGVYEGKLSEDGKEMTGRWKQAGGDLSLTFRRVDKAPELARPQHPKPPFPYDVHEVALENKPAKVKLAGSLTLPRENDKLKGPFPAVLLWSGSGPQDRDETISGHKPFLVIADFLTRRGIAVLRMDDRGVGGSTGDTFGATLNDQVDDAIVCINYLKGRKDIDPARIGFLGHSEGGYVAPLLATRTMDVAFLVILAGPGVTGEEILYLQGQTIVKSLGAKDDALKKQREIQELLFSAVKAEPDNDKALKLMRERLKEIQEKASPLEQIQWAIAQKQLEAQLKTIVTPWFRFFLTYDPRPALRKVDVPVLALIGEKDIQVPPKENVAALEEALKNNRDATVKELAGLNHLFQTAKTGALAEYSRIEETFAPSALELIGAWIVKRTAGQRE